MPLDGITAFFLAEELNESLTGARIDKVQQPSRTDIILTIRNHGRNRKLILSANPSQPRIHFTEESREMPQIAPGFCMLLRKYLVGARIEKVETIGYDRVFVFHVTSQDELGDFTTRRLLLEVMGRYSNLIFINNQDIIIDAINHVDSSMSRVREVMPAHPFMPAPAQDKLEPAAALQAIQTGTFWPTDIIEEQNKKLEHYIMDKIQGVSPQFARDILERAQIDERHQWASLSPLEQQRLNGTLSDILAGLLGGLYEPSLYFRDASDKPIDFHACALVSLGRRESRASISDAMMEFYVAKEASNAFKQRRQHLDKALNQARTKLRKKRDIHAADVDSSRDFDRYREQGDILMSNLHRVKEGDESITAQNFYDPEMADITIALNPHRSPSWNGQHFYKLYTKNKSRFEQASKFLRQDEAELEWLESISNAIENAETMDDLSLIREEMRSGDLITTSGPKQSGRRADDFRGRKKSRSKDGTKQAHQAPLPMRQYVSSDGFTILAGRNNIQNDRLTLRVANKNDLWLHIQKAAGTHVVIRTDGRDVPDQTLLEAAQTAAWFSRSSKGGSAVGGGGGKVAIDYCPVSHVRKPSAAKPGMVIYEGYQTVYVEAVDPAHLLPTELNVETSESADDAD